MKRGTLGIIAVLFSLTLLSLTQTSAQTTGLIAHYTFDDGTAKDIISGINGTVTGGTSVAGKLGNALSFTGANGKITIPQNSALSLTSKTVTFWVKPNLLKFYNVIFEESSNQYAGINEAGEMRVNWKNSADVGKALNINLGVTVGEWQHVALVYSVSGESVTISTYRNGTFVSSISATDGLRSYPITTIAARNFGTNVLDGTLDDLRIYNRALSTSEIGDIYAITLPATPLENPPPPPPPPPSNESPSTESQCTITCHVRTGASGTGSGNDWTNAFPQLPSSLARGVTYYIADGNYPAYIFDDPVDGEKYITIKKATESEHGTNVGWSSTYGDGVAEWQPIMFRTNYINFDGAYGGGPGKWSMPYGFKISTPDEVIFVMFSDKWGSEKTRVDVKDINISHVELAGRAPVTPGWGSGFIATTYMAKTSNVRISHCYVHDIGGLPFRFNDASRITVDTCYVTRNASSDTHHGAGVRLDNVDGFVIKNSIFEDLVGTGFIGGYTGVNNNVELYGNVFLWSPLFKGETNVVGTGGYGNGVIYSIAGSGPIQNWKINNNSFVNLPDASAIINLYNSGGGNEAYNNIFYNYKGQPNFNGITTHDYNYYSTPGNTFSEPNAQNGGTTNPFVSWENKDFRLRGPTQAGKQLSSIYNISADGLVRGADGVWDRGAYEYTGTASPTVTAGDFNSDGVVNSLDLSLMAGAWNTSNATYDLNKDGTVNTLDYSIMVRNWTV